MGFTASQAQNGKMEEPTQIFKWDREWLFSFYWLGYGDKERLKRLNLNDLERSSPIGKRWRVPV